MDITETSCQTPNSSMSNDRVDFQDDEFPPSRIKDPIHQYITLTPYMREFMDTPQFQRLRDLKQLGTTYYVWPGASHNRFEHCLGVAHLAHEQVQHLKRYQRSLNITERDIKCVTLAGLLHDLGHGPFSHVWDEQFIPRARPGETWVHEDGSEMMIDYLIESNEEIKIPQDEVNFIKDLVKGEVKHTRGHNPSEKSFLFEIVANKRNGIDVDKFDYIARDTHAIGDNSNIVSLRLIQSARVMDGQICYNHKDRHSVYRLFQTRFDLHKQYYHHPTAKALEFMVVDALLAADPYLRISERIRDPKRFTYLNDSILLEIESSTDKNLDAARNIISRIRKRELYKLVDFNHQDWDLYHILKEKITPEEIVRIALHSEPCPPPPGTLKPSETWRPLQEEDVIVDICRIHSGRGNDNPMDQVRFFGKYSLDVSHPFTKEAGPRAMPDRFGEVLIRVFSRIKGPAHFSCIQGAYRELFCNVLKDQNPSTPETVVVEAEGSATPSTKVSSLPVSRNASLSSIDTAKVALGTNHFTEVPRGFVPESPARATRRPKRGVPEFGSEPQGSPLKKRKSRND